MSLALRLNLFNCITNQLQDNLTLTGQSYGSVSAAARIQNRPPQHTPPSTREVRAPQLGLFVIPRVNWVHPAPASISATCIIEKTNWKPHLGAAAETETRFLTEPGSLLTTCHGGGPYLGTNNPVFQTHFCRIIILQHGWD